MQLDLKTNLKPQENPQTQGNRPQAKQQDERWQNSLKHRQNAN